DCFISFDGGRQVVIGLLFEQAALERSAEVFGGAGWNDRTQQGDRKDEPREQALEERLWLPVLTPHPGPLPVKGRGGAKDISFNGGGVSRVRSLPVRSFKTMIAATRLRTLTRARRVSLSPSAGEASRKTFLFPREG